VLDPLVKETLTLELAVEPPGAWAEEIKDRPAMDSVSLLVLPGNVSTSLLSRRVAAELGLLEIRRRNASVFVNDVIAGSISYGFAILQPSAVARLQSGLPPDAPAYPTVLGEVAKSRSELVGSAERPDKLRLIYHFPGASFKPLIEQCTKAAPDAQLVPLDVSKLLLPLLSAWSDEKAIIAKPPLSRIYSRFTPAAIREKWQPILEHDEGMQLAVSNALRELPEGLQMIHTVCSTLFKQRERILLDLDHSARDLRAYGLGEYLSELLAYKGQNTRVGESI
jgi:hypothetical protein